MPPSRPRWPRRWTPGSTAAVEVVPELAEHADAVREVLDATAGLDDVPVQQIHADLHLGQTLRTVKGWKIVDFEGEPARPLAERQLPDSPWRDVAGMLRSFDYAPRVVERTFDDADHAAGEQRAFRAAEWSKRNRAAFLAAYAGRELTPGGAPAALGVRRRQGGLRDRLRGAQPTDVGVDPPRRDLPSEALMTATVLPVPREELDLLVRGEHGHPHALLGPHPHEGGVTVRVLKPLASSVVVTWDGERVELDHEHEGVWVGVLPTADVPGYRLEVAYGGAPSTLDDPYRFLPTLGEVDLHLINEGRHENLWEVLGARVHHYARPARRRRSPARRSRCGRPRPAACG